MFKSQSSAKKKRKKSKVFCLKVYHTKLQSQGKKKKEKRADPNTNKQ
jgi:hypothetical protein